MNGKVRTVIYVLLGAIPATLLFLLTLFFAASPGPAGAIPFLALLGVLGLWMAAFDNSALISKKRWLIVLLIIAGVVVLSPITYQFVVSLLSGNIDSMIERPVITLIFNGPIVMALHYLLTTLLTLISRRKNLKGMQYTVLF